MRKPVTRCLAVVALICLGMTTQSDAGLRDFCFPSARVATDVTVATAYPSAVVPLSSNPAAPTSIPINGSARA